MKGELAEAKEREVSKVLEKKAVELTQMNDELVLQVLRMKTLGELANDCQASILDALDLLTPGETFMASTSPVSFVEWDKNRIVFKESWRTRAFAIGELPLGLAFGLADLQLDVSDPKSMAMKAAYAFFQETDQLSSERKTQVVEWMATAERCECVPRGITQLLIETFELTNDHKL